MENHNIVIKNNNIDNIILHSEQSSQVNVIIDLFKNVNPSYQRLFANKTQRKSVERLILFYGLEKLKRIVNFLPKNNATEYATVIISPRELEDKIGKLQAFWHKNLKPKSKKQGYLHDGTFVIKQFGRWVLPKSPNVNLDPHYYPEIEKDEILNSTPEKIKKLT